MGTIGNMGAGDASLTNASCLLMVSILSVGQYPLRTRIFLFNALTAQRQVIDMLVVRNLVEGNVVEVPVLVYLLLVAQNVPLWFDHWWLNPVLESTPVSGGPWLLAMLRMSEASKVKTRASDAQWQAAYAQVDDVLDQPVPPRMRLEQHSRLGSASCCSRSFKKVVRGSGRTTTFDLRVLDVTQGWRDDQVTCAP